MHLEDDEIRLAIAALQTAANIHSCRDHLDQYAIKRIFSLVARMQQFLEDQKAEKNDGR